MSGMDENPYKAPRIVLFSGLALASSVFGALFGVTLAANNSIPSISNTVFACGWGATVWTIPAFGLAAYISDQGSSKVSRSILYATLVGVALVSGWTIYLFSVQTAAI